MAPVQKIGTEPRKHSPRNISDPVHGALHPHLLIQYAQEKLVSLSSAGHKGNMGSDSHLRIYILIVP